MAESEKDKKRPGPEVKPKVELLREFDARDPLVIMKKVNEVITILGDSNIIGVIKPAKKENIT